MNYSKRILICLIALGFTMLQSEYALAWGTPQADSSVLKNLTGKNVAILAGVAAVITGIVLKPYIVRWWKTKQLEDCFKLVTGRNHDACRHPNYERFSELLKNENDREFLQSFVKNGGLKTIENVTSYGEGPDARANELLFQRSFLGSMIKALEKKGIQISKENAPKNSRWSILSYTWQAENTPGTAKVAFELNTIAELLLETSFHKVVDRDFTDKNLFEEKNGDLLSYDKTLDIANKIRKSNATPVEKRKQFFSEMWEILGKNCTFWPQLMYRCTDEEMKKRLEETQKKYFALLEKHKDNLDAIPREWIKNATHDFALGTTQYGFKK